MFGRADGGRLVGKGEKCGALVHGVNSQPAAWADDSTVGSAKTRTQ